MPYSARRQWAVPRGHFSTDRLLVRPLPAGSPVRGSRWYRRRPAGTRV